MPTVYVLNGPNLNLLGQRQPKIYGRETLGDIHARLDQRARALGLAVEFRQSNYEGELVDWIQEARKTACGIIINAGAYSHSSIAILDALLACELPVIEVHLSNIYKREPFRHKSYISAAALGIICGLGPMGYELALDALAARLQSTPAAIDV
jgi:3-dehydroquinate dehydratase-2